MAACSWKQCSKLIDSSSDARVEVKCRLTRAARENGEKCEVVWSRRGEAVFHRDCWENLTSSERLCKFERPLVRDAQKTAEFHSSEAEVRSTANAFLSLLRQSRHCTVFTGAGISTAAGIGDFRGKSGKWTEADRVGGIEEKPEPDDSNGVPYDDLRPTLTHESIKLFADAGLVRHVISQNCDGLHQLSGLVPGEQLSELHGNVFVERCERCATRYTRPFYTCFDGRKGKFVKQCSQCRLNHRTGRRCEKSGCSGFLIDTIINFSDDLEDAVFEKAYQEARKSDLILVLGSSIKVTPAANLVNYTKQLVICNRQPTDKDDDAVLRVYGDCDRFLEAVLRLNQGDEAVDKWILERSKRLAHYLKLRT